MMMTWKEIFELIVGLLQMTLIMVVFCAILGGVGYAGYRIYTAVYPEQTIQLERNR